MTTSHWFRPSVYNCAELSTDVLIVGGGYAGLSTAYWLTELRPDLRITILDRNQIGAGASGRNAGFLTKGSAAFYQMLTRQWGREKALEIFRFAEESLRLISECILRSLPEIKYEENSSLTLFQDESLLQQWKQEDFDLCPFKFSWVSNQFLPEKLAKNFLGAYENGIEYKINPMELVVSLKKKLESRDVQILEGAAAFEITSIGARTETCEIKAKQVVLALNGYFSQFHSAFKPLVIPCRAQMLAVKISEHLKYPSLYYDPMDRVYWRKTQDNLLLIGGKRLLAKKDEIGDFEKISPIVQEGLESYLREKLELEFKVINRWSGIMGFTEHELPFVTDNIESPIQTFAIGGFSGHGMGLGFLAAKEMAEIVCGKKKDSFFSQFKRVKLSL
jgi:gamma-glutamylputrescine oxidase